MSPVCVAGCCCRRVFLCVAPGASREAYPAARARAAAERLQRLAARARDLHRLRQRRCCSWETRAPAPAACCSGSGTSREPARARGAPAPLPAALLLCCSVSCRRPLDAKSREGSSQARTRSARRDPRPGARAGRGETPEPRGERSAGRQRAGGEAIGCCVPSRLACTCQCKHALAVVWGRAVGVPVHRGFHVVRLSFEKSLQGRRLAMHAS